MGAGAAGAAGAADGYPPANGDPCGTGHANAAVSKLRFIGTDASSAADKDNKEQDQEQKNKDSAATDKWIRGTRGIRSLLQLS